MKPNPKTNPDNGFIDIKLADFGVCNVIGKSTIIGIYSERLFLHNYIRPDSLRHVLRCLPGWWESLLSCPGGSEGR